MRRAGRINTFAIRDIRVMCERSMSCLAAIIDGWRVLDGARKWMMQLLRAIRGATT